MYQQYKSIKFKKNMLSINNKMINISNSLESIYLLYPQFPKMINSHFDQKLYDEQNKKMSSKLFPIEKLNQNLINVKESFDVKNVLDDIISKCSCHHIIGINSSMKDLIYSAMCANCYSNFEFVCCAMNCEINNNWKTHIYDNYFSIHPISEEWLICNKKICSKLLKYWKSLNKKHDNKDFNKYYQLIDCYFRDQYYSNLLNKEQESERLKKDDFGCLEPMVCDGCSYKLICSTYIKNSLPIGSYGSRIFDLDHVHMVDQSKLPIWWIDGACICDWCFYQVVKSGAITDVIDGYYCENCTIKIREYNEII